MNIFMHALKNLKEYLMFWDKFWLVATTSAGFWTLEKFSLFHLTVRITVVLLI